MDASSSVPTSKKRKLGEGQNSGEHEDRINRLPDTMLTYIISFLPTKNAVGTSVLAKRWKNLWASVPVLDFDDTLILSKSSNKKRRVNKFMNFVDRVLHLHDLPNIQKFSLKCLDTRDASRIDSWITTALKHRVEEIFLNLKLDNACLLPSSFFICESLKTLKITGDFYEDVDYIYKIPSCIRWSSLKFLNLDSLRLFSDRSTHQVSLCCPILEKLVLKFIEWWNIQSFSISAPALQRCTMTYNDWGHGCATEVHAENITYLKLRSTMVNELSLHNLSSLATAYIDICSSAEIGNRMSKVLQAVCNVKDLTFTDYAIAVIYRLDLLDHLHAFSSLMCLKVKILHYQSRDDQTGSNVRQLIDLLYHLPNVELLLLENGSSGCGFVEHEDGGALDVIPQRNLTRLKSVKLEQFHGSANELYLVNFLLKNVVALEKITIISSSKLSSDPKMQFEVAKNLLLHRGSTHSEIEFS
ncbi:hypothetical protein IFM89_035718 [Coptis chinensis]|uniref:F-box domain-containing protein n=1 Tax=Coptis chinensis TaxID=261450 RepID=A0A835H1B2_9MAGN|nr:hypothetical protein IFM89_035718 [Coptis chinensis]